MTHGPINIIFTCDIYRCIQIERKYKEEDFICPFSAINPFNIALFVINTSDFLQAFSCVIFFDFIQ